MKRFQRQVVLVALTLLGSAGCADRPIVGSDSAESPLEAKLGQPPQQQIWTSDDEFARVARAEVPGFAGYYFDMTGTPIILVKDHRQGKAAARYVAPLLAQASRGRNAGPLKAPIIRKVAHDFAELKGWFDQLDGLMPRDGVYSLDVDEVGNRISVGVRDDAVIRSIRREAARLRVPPGILAFRIERPAELRITLQDWTSTLTGGFQIDGPETATSSGECTYGFNAVYQNMWMFVTNSHCTYNYFAMGNTILTQPSYYQGNEIGTEYADRGMYACAGTGTSCRRSDAAYIKLNGSRTIGQGKIAYTELSYGRRSSLEVLGYYDVVRRFTAVAVGTFLDKTGRTSGTTYGQVTEACRTLYSGPYELRCQDISTVWSEPGDSGSPMYVWRDGVVELYGILWGGPDGDFMTTYSSRLSGIEQDLGALTYLCAPGYGC
jgi:hypothetical protein